MTKRIQFTSPFNRNIPPLFSKTGLLYPLSNIGPRVGLMVEMPEEHFSLRDWSQLYRAARRELADNCYAQERCPTDSELSQMLWLQEAGHHVWLKPNYVYPRCNLNRVIEKLEADNLRLRGVIEQLKSS